MSQSRHRHTQKKAGNCGTQKLEHTTAYPFRLASGTAAVKALSVYSGIRASPLYLETNTGGRCDPKPAGVPKRVSTPVENVNGDSTHACMPMVGAAGDVLQLRKNMRVRARTRTAEAGILRRGHKSEALGAKSVASAAFLRRPEFFSEHPYQTLCGNRDIGLIELYQKIFVISGTVGTSL